MGMFSLLASIPFVEQDGMETSTAGVATNYRNILRLNVYPAPFRAPSGNSRKCKIRQHLSAQHKIRHVLSFFVFGCMLMGPRLRECYKK